MTDTFTLAISFVLAKEGGLSDDAGDPGGLTNFGLTTQDVPDPTKLTRDQAISIYQTRYWLKCQCDKLPPALAVMHFDAAVNEGPGAAAKFLQQAVGVTVDGVVGPKTLAAADAADWHEALVEYAARRGVQYASLDGRSPQFELGWQRRLMACLALAITLV